MKPLHDYLYRFPHNAMRLPGRCRVRIYPRQNGAHTVVLTELNLTSAESISSACERIATHLTAVRRLNPKTTRWIQHDPPHDELPHSFGEVRFTWDAQQTACDPQWQDLEDAQVEALTGASLQALNRRLGDFGFQKEEETTHEAAETEGAA